VEEVEDKGGESAQRGEEEDMDLQPAEAAAEATTVPPPANLYSLRKNRK